MPHHFELDSTPGRVGQKATWRAALIERLKAMVQQQREETVTAGWDPALNAPRVVQLDPLADFKRRNPIYHYACSSTAAERRAKFKALEDKLQLKNARMAELVGDGTGKVGLIADAKSERDDASTDSRSEYLQVGGTS
jgi:hypothetical protein